ncbi:hypothetical protein Micbo1qcDRAFT_220592 [Microdochium bolleyi]|uniref:Alpha-L-rhamnosidase C-terminal domain-containing protein n=1 Tax=Microdochium bolleyi TaxID=196109 RepID=A0A136JA12_9PEZI|nr:hypothetical protein Micbo1qcDRAFT_220592 [Microdochium bolleyi]
MWASMADKNAPSSVALCSVRALSLLGGKNGAVAPLTVGECWARGKVPTASGAVSVQWKFCDDLVTMTVQSPEGTKGNVTSPSPMLLDISESTIRVDGVVVEGISFEVQGGAAVHIVQSRK